MQLIAKSFFYDKELFENRIQESNEEQGILPDQYHGTCIGTGLQPFDHAMGE